MKYSIYEIIKFWLPIVTAFGFILRGYHTITRNVSEWADKLLHNHLSHIEQNTAQSVVLLAGVRDWQDKEGLKIETHLIRMGADMVDNQKDLVEHRGRLEENLAKVAVELAAYQKRDEEIQRNILKSVNRAARKQ